ncbi:hypothetical protein B4N89_46060 [Embleya scabrispora]|uniref:Acyl-CoA thioesterase-like N-terminal HotDog domain-containing protein n=1 Tax=Embleya scabrispora TaxID=159449 RepID=A0A1T3NJF2_9ACTN|nr:acyl-CoA thioesterase domain-containing protein [Embleya scabrispora]OPC76840.1 hypothetical protein B4N89_46060 [Embleya scabrispora]
MTTPTEILGFEPITRVSAEQARETLKWWDPNVVNAERHEVAAALRRLNSVLLAADPTTQTDTIHAMRLITEMLCERAALLPRASASTTPGPGERCPVGGWSNAISSPLLFSVDNGCVRADGNFLGSQEGVTGRAHGGSIAASFDAVISAGQIHLGWFGYTRRLTVEYLAPVPLGRRVNFHVAVRDIAQDDRSAVLHAHLRSDDRLLAQATADIVRSGRW